MSNASLPTTLADTQPLAAQVGGHAGVRTTEDGSLLLKPALPRELDFYQLIAAASDNDELSKLKKWIPTFLGILRLEGKLKDPTGNEGEGNIEVVPVDDDSGLAPGEKESLVLENIAHGFVKPCILDVKLGTVLYDEDASPEKKARMIKTARNTTSEETGVRLTGFQVYSNDSPKPITTPKSYGKSISKEQLPEGIEMFFPVSSTSYPTAPNPLEATSDSEAHHFGLPPTLLHRVLTILEADLEELRSTISNIEMRIVGGSILVVYEGDWDRASKAFSTHSRPATTQEEEEDDDDDDDDDEQVEVEIDENGQVIFESIADDVMDDAEEEKHQAPLCCLSLLDFAHTRLAKGEGADEGVLKGMQTMIDLVRRRRDKISAMLPSGG